MAACRTADPSTEFERIQAILRHGDVARAHQESLRAAQSFPSQDSEWHWRFTILDATALNLSGNYKDVLALLVPPLPNSLKNSDVALQKDLQQAQALLHLHRFDEAETLLKNGSFESPPIDGPVAGELAKARGMLLMEKGEYAEASGYFSKMLSIARQHRDPFLESMALLDMGFSALQQEHFDEAVDWSKAAIAHSKTIDAQLVEEVALGNLGWAWYKTGDPERALALFLDADTRAKGLGDVAGEILWLTAMGYVYLDEKRYDIAASSYQKALDLARATDSKEDILNAVTSLALSTAQSGDLAEATRYSEDAIAMARAGNNRVDELYPLLAKGTIALRRRDFSAAERTFRDIAGYDGVDASLKWGAEHGLALAFQEQGEDAQAQAAYNLSLATLESARSELTHEDTRLPFLSNAGSLYDNYVSFLVAKGKTAQALNVADHARARTLAEGLGQLQKSESVFPTSLDAQRIAKTAGGAVLYYWLGQKQSYLWAITPQKTSLFQLPSASEIDAIVKRYRKALERPQEGIQSQNRDGIELFRMLVQPAQALIAKSAKIFVVPDGSLNSLNFEALLVPQPRLHYWIEDATIAQASSLRLLAASHPNAQRSGGRLLLLGNPVSPTPEYTTPPQAAKEMKGVGGRFPASSEVVFGEAAATPKAYLASSPGQFAYIHFVAHGTASRLSPLDSAIVLSRSSADDDAFRLYARDIIQHPLRADLVTISACYGAGSRAYSGEGLVGLSWAFLRAGAHNVVGALWDVSDASTPMLMDQMYAEIRAGKRPEVALRLAKLSLLRSDNAFHNPFYWAPFQLYTGS